MAFAISVRVFSFSLLFTGLPDSSFRRVVPPEASRTGMNSPFAPPTPSVYMTTPFSAAFLAALRAESSSSSPSLISTIILRFEVEAKATSASSMAADMFVPPRCMTFVSSASSDILNAS